MTQEERKKFDAFQRQLNESPANRISFFAGVDEECMIANTPYEQWVLQSEYENKAICKHLGIEYRKEDFAVSAEGLAKQTWDSENRDVGFVGTIAINQHL